MKSFVIAAFVLIFISPLTTLADINFGGPISPPAGSNFVLPKDPAELLDKAVDKLPQSDEDLKALGEKAKASFGSETGQRVRAVLKDIGKAFVWATELMVRGLKYLINKL